MEHILTFGSAHRALKADSILRDASMPFRLLPAPKALAKHCDLVISVKDGLEAALGVLKNAGVEPRYIYRKEGEEYVKV